MQSNFLPPGLETGSDFVYELAGDDFVLELGRKLRQLFVIYFFPLQLDFDMFGAAHHVSDLLVALV